MISFGLVLVLFILLVIIVFGCGLFGESSSSPAAGGYREETKSGTTEPTIT